MLRNTKSYFVSEGISPSIDTSKNVVISNDYKPNKLNQLRGEINQELVKESHKP